MTGLLLFAVLAAAAPVATEPRSGGDGESPPARTEAPAASTDRDVFDLLRDVLNKPDVSYDTDRMMVAAAPIVSYGPATGFGIGAAGNIAFYRGSPVSTQISSLVASATMTSKSQVLVNAKLDVSAADNRWNFVGDNRLYWTSQTTYGLGSTTPEEQALGMAFDYFKLHEVVYRKVRRNLFVGAGLLYGLHQDIRPDVEELEDDDDDDVADDVEPTVPWEESEYVRYTNQHGFDLEQQTSAGASLQVLFNSRDSPINPSRGWYASAGYQMFFEGFLGGSSTWQQLNGDLRTYVRLTDDARHRLAFWTFGNFVTGGSGPYLDLPATGWDTYGRSGRGYSQGRFRGPQMLYGEVEYRWTITRNKLLGLVAFANTETLSDPDADEALFDAFAHGAGVGLRVLINKQSKTNLGVDIGIGRDGDRSIYLAVQEAF